MRNRYGQELDRNGYAPSIVGEMGRCCLCGRTDRALQRHEVYHGAYRDKSKNLGTWVNICDLCHDRVHHHEASLDRELKEMMQKKAMERYGWSVDEFRAEFGKSYI